jgi:hypothetical protein
VGSSQKSCQCAEPAEVAVAVKGRKMRDVTRVLPVDFSGANKSPSVPRLYAPSIYDG